jgi:hypothetical protein
VIRNDISQIRSPRNESGNVDVTKGHIGNHSSIIHNHTVYLEKPVRVNHPMQSCRKKTAAIVSASAGGQEQEAPVGDKPRGGREVDGEAEEFERFGRNSQRMFRNSQVQVGNS